jgi:hypothetical protein
MTAMTTNAKYPPYLHPPVTASVFCDAPRER